VSVEAVIIAPAPTFTVATAKDPMPVGPGMSTIPGSPLATSATMSGTGVTEADSSRVLTPTIVAACTVLVPVKVKGTSVGAKALVGVMASTNDWLPPGESWRACWGYQSGDWSPGRSSGRKTSPGWTWPARCSRRSQGTCRH
jgi:hypothetical protein